jgi:hypothetical protein
MIDMKAPKKPVSFGYKCAWCAISSTDVDKVVKAISLVKPRQCSWQKGVEKAYDGFVFVSPRVRDWIFVVSWSLMPPYQDTAKAEISPKIMMLSRTFGTTLFFTTYRVPEYHIYAKAVDGKLIRGYGYIGERGETFWNEGRQTKEERELGFKFFNESCPAAKQPAYWERKDLSFLNEKKIMLLAGKWSVDPSCLDEWPDPVSQAGRLGEEARLFRFANRM